MEKGCHIVHFDLEVLVVNWASLARYGTEKNVIDTNSKQDNYLKRMLRSGQINERKGKEWKTKRRFVLKCKQKHKRH